MYEEERKVIQFTKRKEMWSLKNLFKSNDTETPIKSIVEHSLTEKKKKKDLRLQNKMAYAVPSTISNNKKKCTAWQKWKKKKPGTP